MARQRKSKDVKLNDECFAAICAQLASGSTAKKACQDHNVTDGALWQLCQDDASALELLARARRFAAIIHCYDEVDFIKETCMDPEITNAQANGMRVAFDAVRWQIERADAVTAKTPAEEKPLTTEQADEIAALLKERNRQEKKFVAANAAPDPGQ